MTIKPSLEEVKNIAKEYNTIPLSCELPMNYTPVGIIKKIRAVSSHCFMLESKEDTKQTGRYTFIGFDPKAEISCTNYSVCVVDDMGVRRFRGNPRSYVKELLDSHKAPRFDYLPDFTGGLVGYFGYDYVKYSEPSLNLNAQDDGSFKDVDLMLFDKVIAFDNAEEKIILIVNIQTDDCEKNYALVVYGLDCLDEISAGDATYVAEVRDGNITDYEIKPEDFGFERVSKSDLLGSAPAENAEIAKNILSGHGTDAQNTAVSLNAGACIYVSQRGISFINAVKKAKEILLSGKGSEVLEKFIETTNEKV